MRWPWAKAVPALTPEEREAISKLARCPYCAGHHAFTCPYIQEIELDGGRPKRIRFSARFQELIKDILYLE